MENWIYDTEVFPNFTCFCFVNYKTEERKYFEVSTWKNDRNLLIKFVDNICLIGYNNMMYDNLLLNYIMLNESSTTEIYNFSKYIIENENGEIYESIKKYKYSKKFESVDIMRTLFSKTQRVSLKELQVTLNWHNVLECELDFNKEIRKDDIESIVFYCYNDCESTKYLTIKSKDKLNLRTIIEKNFGIKCMSKDDVRTGVDLFAKLYENDSKDKEFKDKRTRRSSINLNEIISDKVHFQSETFKDFLNLLKNKTIYGTKGVFDYEIIYKGVKYVYGTGGIHSKDNPGHYSPKTNELLIDADVSSLYPSVLILLNACPKHLNSELFIPRYKWLRDTRIKAKHEKNTLLADTFKLSLNGTYGNLISDHSWLYDPQAAMTVTINGQLFLTMLAERIADAGFQIESVNTDGITTFVNKNRIEEYQNICKNWESEIGLELEFAYYYKIFRRNVNSYFAWYADKNGEALYKNDKPYIKEKGEFLTSIVLGKGYDMPIVSKALKQYFIDGTDIETFIKSHNNIYDFCKMQKVDRKFKTVWGGVEQQRTNRFFVSVNPNCGYLYKVDKNNNKAASILKGFGVEIFNKFEEREMKDYRINYGYYCSEARKILYEIDPKIYNLFE